MELSDFQMKLVGWREMSGKEKLYILPDVVYRISNEKVIQLLLLCLVHLL